MPRPSLNRHAFNLQNKLRRPWRRIDRAGFTLLGFWSSTSGGAFWPLQFLQVFMDRKKHASAQMWCHKTRCMSERADRLFGRWAHNSTLFCINDRKGVSIRFGWR